MKFLAHFAVISGLSALGIFPPCEQSPTQSGQQPSKRILSAPKTTTQLFFEPDSILIHKVDSVYHSMTDKQRAAQMIMTASSTVPKLGYPYDKARRLIKEGWVGNLVFLKGSKSAFATQVRELNTLPGLLRPLYACDCEPSLMNSKWSGTQQVLKANQQNTEELVATNTHIIISDMKEVGVQLNFAPVADNALNKDVISTRAFGNDPASIIRLSKKFIEVSQNQKIGTSIKHFPGHGNVKGDSHKELVFIDGELQELNTFRQIIQGNTPPLTVMVGHIAIRNNDKYNTQDMPSTLSRKIVTGLLRQELKYNGIITTDAMNMLAVSKVPNADWKAVEAGIDLVLMPANPQALNQRITEALQQKGALAQQIEASVKRIIRLKLVLGII
ncbi:MAG: hypothetical protein KL787_10515 [Taibaiella sp.]|nr:hypothetical protein [Taibaiella sp.]